MKNSTAPVLNGSHDPGSSIPEISIVIPFYNEEESVAAVLDEVQEIVGGMGLRYEIVAIDDGSTDGTARMLETFAHRDKRVRVLGTKVNRGQAAALYWGLRSAFAPVIVTMDGDGQNDPSDIPELLADLKHADMVVGVRARRRDSALRQRMSRIANTVRGALLKDHMLDSGCALKVFRREVVDSFLPIQTLYSFMPAFAVAAGFRLGQRNVQHRPRKKGTSSYGLRKFLWRPLLDLLGVWWFTRRRFPLFPAGGEG